MSMQDWVEQTDQFLANNRREVLDGKGKISKFILNKSIEILCNFTVLIIIIATLLKYIRDFLIGSTLTCPNFPDTYRVFLGSSK